MKKILIIIIFIISINIFSEELKFNVKTGDKTSLLNWQIETKGKFKTYNFSMNEVKQTIIYENNEITSWRYYDIQNKFTAERNKENIMISGTFKNKSIEKKIFCGNKKWMQNSEFSLLNFLDSSKNEELFFMIDPMDLSLKELKVTKEKDEKIIIGGREYLTLKLKAVQDGFFSFIWSSYYWYEKSTKKFLKYKADGFLTIPETTVEFIE